MLAYGATFDLTPKEQGMKGALARAEELVDADPGRVDAAAVREPGQRRRSMPRPPRRRSSRDFADSPIDVAHHRRRHRRPPDRLRRSSSRRPGPSLKAYAVEPTLSPVISGGQPGPHPIQGIGAGFIPTNLHTQAIDGAIQVEPEDAKEMARRCAREEGLLVGISSGATLAAIAQKLAELPAGARVLGFNYDTGERYLSVPDFLPTE